MLESSFGKCWRMSAFTFRCSHSSDDADSAQHCRQCSSQIGTDQIRPNDGSALQRPMPHTS